jgi:hypothetical protein
MKFGKTADEWFVLTGGGLTLSIYGKLKADKAET